MHFSITKNKTRTQNDTLQYFFSPNKRCPYACVSPPPSVRAEGYRPQTHHWIRTQSASTLSPVAAARDNLPPSLPWGMEGVPIFFCTTSPLLLVVCHCTMGNVSSMWWKKKEKVPWICRALLLSVLLLLFSVLYGQADWKLWFFGECQANWKTRVFCLAVNMTIRNFT